MLGGCSFLGDEGDMNHTWNTRLASALGTPMLLLQKCSPDSTPTSIFQSIMMTIRELTEGDNVVDLSGVIINQIPEGKCAS